jgi:hypothetical protein
MNVDAAAPLVGTPGFLIGILTVIAAIVGALAGPVFRFFSKRHQQSGTVETSQAEDLWLNINSLLAQYKEDLRETRAELVTTRAELVSTREALLAVQPMLARLAQIEKSP